LATGQRVVAIVRPEAVAIVAEPRASDETRSGPPVETPTTNVVQGVVESREYLGAVLRYAVRVGPGTLLAADVHKPDPGALRQEGERVRLTFAPGDVLLYPAERP
jgi:ABC-type Fe3+/spermidine/putrescine transport system ATPase subunit